MQTQQSSEEVPDEELSTIRRDEINFFYAVGVCVTDYQKIEDYLTELFIEAIKINSLTAKPLFELYKGLDIKLKAINTLISLHRADLLQEWRKLEMRISNAQQNRNLIAHCTPTFVSQTIIVLIGDNDENGVAQIEYRNGSEPSQFKFIKKQKNGEKHWSISDLNSEIQSLQKLFTTSIGFSYKLKNQLIPEHLMADYELL